MCHAERFLQHEYLQIHYVVQHYLGVQDLAQRLASGDRTLVEDLRTVPIVTSKGERKVVDYYSFATKFCSHHEPDKFPIYDKFVARMLEAFALRDNPNSNLWQKDLKVYQTFCDEIVKFRDRYGLANYTFKELDRYLWLLGKELSGK